MSRHLPLGRRHRRRVAALKLRRDQFPLGGRLQTRVRQRRASPSSRRCRGQPAGAATGVATQMRKALLPALEPERGAGRGRVRESARHRRRPLRAAAPDGLIRSSKASRPTTAATSSTCREQPFTVREWGWIKRHTGYLPLTLFGRAGKQRRGADGGVRDHRAGTGPARSTATTCRRPGNGSRTRPVSSPSGSSSTDPEEDDADPPSSPPSSNENGSTSGDDSTDEFGELGRDPASYWDPRLGYFGIPPGEVVGDLTPVQLLETVDCFQALHGGGAVADGSRETQRRDRR